MAGKPSPNSPPPFPHSQSRTLTREGRTTRRKILHSVCAIPCYQARHPMKTFPTFASLILLFLAAAAAEPTLVRTAQTGAWSEAKTWEGGKLPPPGAKVLVRPGHDVLYDVNSPQ